MKSLVAQASDEQPSSAKTKRKPIPARVQNIVWGRAAGRCQYAGCNALLVGDEISGAANANKAYIGHIVADSPEGPRGHPVRSFQLAHDPDNLMLVCDVHHRVFDREMVDEHPEHVLVAMKRGHEARIRTVTGIDENLGSHVIRYAAKIADERVTNVLGPEASVWSIAAEGAHNDIVRRPEDVSAFAKLFRKTLDDIKLAHGETVTVHVFPAVPVSIAVEAGRSWQPKAHPPLTIYDQNWKLGGFALAHRLEHAD